MSVEAIVFIMFSLLLVALFSGLPLAFAVGGVGVICLFWLWQPQAASIIVLVALDKCSSFILLAVPLFIFMAMILERTGIPEDLYTSLYAWTSELRGGLAMGTVVVGALMAAMVGIVGAEVVTLGIIALPGMLMYKYDKKIALGTCLAAGTLGQLIPPSILFIVYGAEAGLSVGKLFMGGFPAGLILACLFILYIGTRSFIQKELCPVVPREDRPSFRQKMATLHRFIPPLFLIFAVLGSIYTGIATPTEAASVGAVGAFLIGLAHRRMSWRVMKEAATRTFATTGMVMWVIIGASCFTVVFTALGAPEFIEQTITGLALGRWGVFTVMMFILLILGCFLDPVCIILLTVPIFSPLLKVYQFDPLWFGIVYVTNLQMSYITPPFGFSLFYIKGVAPPDITMGDIYRSVWPFVLLQITGIVIMAIFPNAILWLPRMMIK